MENATTIGLSRLIAQTREMELSATNIANAATPGFRAERMIFSDLLVREGSAALPGGEKALTYTADRATYRETTAGALTHTGNPLDLAIAGDGFFTVGTRNGPRLTRAGHFTAGPDGNIVDAEGNPLLDANGRPIQVGATDTQIGIAADGTVDSQNGQLGKIGIVTVVDPTKLKAEGGRLLSAVATATAPDPQPKLVQGAIEGSDVQPAVELTRMIGTQRGFEMLVQFVQSESDRQQNAIQKIMQTNG
ncbi:MAG TPA: flagellar basal-body rod protein FlgF [Acetobacteraceae bacterium]|jgi:flagellar basal-body rod protein FlgF|nr:flagellar basal-body rod protein FlgF [Acetobacteraceae bacterium]